MIKAAFFDIDGTVFSHSQGKIPASTIEAMRLLKEKNILRILASGRHKLEVDALPLQQLDFDGYILLNGQICCDQNFTPFYDSPFPRENLAPILEIFRSKKFPILLVSKDRFYINTVNELVEAAQKALSVPIPEISDYQGEDLYQLDIYALPGELEDVAAQIPHCKTMRWHSYGIDVIPDTGGKMNGIRQMLTHIHCTPEEIIAFGDGENDIDMLKFAGIGVAMGNANDLVKSSADFITKDIDDDGILFALKELHIL